MPDTLPQLVIDANNISKKYEVPVLHNISLQVKGGEIVGYIGPNGAGKSTTIKILSGIISDFEGQAKILGLDLRSDAIELKKRVGYIPENAALYELLTPMEYLSFVGSLYHMRPSSVQLKAAELLRLFDLQEDAQKRMASFSKGMRQKVLLIAGLLHNPELIFLDEPLSGLDAHAVIFVKELITQLKKLGKTIFYSSHLMDVVEKISDRIIIINEGAIVANGTFHELKNQASQGSLEEIFTRLTGQHDYNASAAHFLDVIRND